MVNLPQDSPYAIWQLTYPSGAQGFPVWKAVRTSADENRDMFLVGTRDGIGARLTDVAPGTQGDTGDYRWYSFDPRLNRKKPLEEGRKTMSRRITMRFVRDVFTGPACLEYSWVPEGKRHTILLDPGQPEGFRTDPIADDIHPSFVQVYRLSNNQRTSLEMWQFPKGPPPHGSDVDRAEVEVHESTMEAVGTVFYTDGTSASGRHRLDPFAGVPESPAPPEGSAGSDPIEAVVSEIKDAARRQARAVRGAMHPRGRRGTSWSSPPIRRSATGSRSRARSSRRWSSAERRSRKPTPIPSSRSPSTSRTRSGGHSCRPSESPRPRAADAPGSRPNRAGTGPPSAAESAGLPGTSLPAGYVIVNTDTDFTICSEQFDDMDRAGHQPARRGEPGDVLAFSQVPSGWSVVGTDTDFTRCGHDASFNNLKIIRRLA